MKPRWKRVVESMLGALVVIGFIPAIIAAWWASVLILRYIGAPDLVCIMAVPFATIYAAVAIGIYNTRVAA